MVDVKGGLPILAVPDLEPSARVPGMSLANKEMFWVIERRVLARDMIDTATPPEFLRLHPSSTTRPSFEGCVGQCVRQYARREQAPPPSASRALP